VVDVDAGFDEVVVGLVVRGRSVVLVWDILWLCKLS